MEIKIFNNNYNTIDAYPNITLFSGILLVSFAPAIPKLINLNPIGIGFWRMFIGIPFLFLLQPKQLFQINKNNLKYFFLLILIALSFFLSIALFQEAIYYTTLTNTGTFSAMTPIYVTLLYWIFYKKPIGKYVIITLCFSTFGILQISNYEIEFRHAHLFGDICAILTSIFYAIYIIGIQKIVKHFSACFILLITQLVSSIGLVSYNIITHQAILPHTGIDCFYLIILGLMCQTLGYYFITTALPRLNILYGTLCLLLEPIIAIIFGVFTFNEIINLNQAIGTTFILISIIIAKLGLNTPNFKEEPSNTQIQ